MVVGAVLVPVPLVPGIPFLILSSYFFAKATVLKEGMGLKPKSKFAKQKSRHSRAHHDRCVSVENI